jgi:hypothetical protein
MADISILDPSVSAAPKAYTVHGAQEIVLKSVTASYDGTGAAGPYVPAVQIIDPSGFVAGTYTLGVTLAAGGTADISWFPGLGGSGSSQAILKLLDLVDFAPAGNKVTITSTDPNSPTTIVTGNNVAYDGLTQVDIQFFAAGIDCDQRFQTGLAAVLLELYVDNTASGVLFDFNVNNGDYGQVPCFLSAIDTPPAGSHAYSIRGYKQSSGGSIGAANVYGNGVVTPHATRPGFLAVFATEM